MEKKSIFLYEEFHRKTKLQKRIIGRKHFTYRLLLDVLEPYLTGKKRILDIGCGAGTLSFYMANKGNYVRGIEISPRATEACKLSAKQIGLEKNTNFQTGDFTRKIIDEQFDLILCSEVLEHLRSDKLAVGKIFASLNNGGVMIVSVPSKNSPLFKLGLSEKFDERAGHLRRYDQNELVALLKRVNLKVLEIKRTEGVLRNFLFISRLGSLVIRVINRLAIISDIFTFLDNITLKLFGESQIIVVAQKPKKKK